MFLSGSPSYTTEALFGPPSQRIDVNEFIQSAQGLLSGLPAPTQLADPDIANECRVDEIRDTVEDALSNPFKHAHILRAHEKAVQALRLASNAAKKSKDADNGGGLNEVEPAVRSDVASLASSLSAINLASWPYPPEAALFTRPPKNSDLNVLRTIKKASAPARTPDDDSQGGAQARRYLHIPTASTETAAHLHLPTPEESESDAEESRDEQQEAVIIVSVYTRLSWNTQLARLSQHAVVSSQTLGDLYDAIPCSANEIPLRENRKSVFSTPLTRDDVDHFATGADAELSSGHLGAVMCIEDVAYGDGQSEEDYSDKLLKQLAAASTEKNPGPQLSKGRPMHAVRFRDLSLRVNAPYWLLHQGSCEHFLIVDCIRLLHPSDPQPVRPDSDGLTEDVGNAQTEDEDEDKEPTYPLAFPYPLTLHISPPILDLCQACSRVPATLSITGDVRLGQSPFKVCGPCWECLGAPTEEEREGRKVEVVPLVRHEHGW